MKNSQRITKVELLRYFLLFLYFLSISAFRLGVGFDAIFVRVIFALIMISSFFGKKFSPTGILMWNIGFWSYYYFSALWAESPSDTLSNTVLAIQVIGLFIFLPTYIKDKDSFISVLKTLLYSLLCSIVMLVIKTPISDFGTERLGEAIGLNPNAFGLRMAIGAIISLFLFHSEDKIIRRKKALFLALVILFVLFALLSGSKKALTVVLISLAGYSLLSAKGMKTVVKIIGLIAFVVIVFAVIFTNQQLYNTIGFRLEKTFYTLTDQAGAKNTDNSLVERGFYIDQAMMLFRKHPIFGYGGNNFRTYMRDIGYSHATYSHNNYTEILCTLGVIGAIIYYSIWIATVYRLIEIYIFERKINIRNPATITSLIMVLALLVIDYGMVSYCVEFNMIVFCIAYLYSKSKRAVLTAKIKKERNEIQS